MVSRRRFVSAATASLVAAGLPTALPSAVSAAGKYSARWWRKRLGAEVELQGDLWHLGELVEVRENTSSAEVEQFSLVFRGSLHDSLAEGIYRVRVGERRVKLFVQPSGGDETSNYYVASIARFK